MHILIAFVTIPRLIFVDASITYARAVRQPSGSPSGSASFGLRTSLLHSLDARAITRRHPYTPISVGPLTRRVRTTRLTANLYLFRHNLLQLLYIRTC